MTVLWVVLAYYWVLSFHSVAFGSDTARVVVDISFIFKKEIGHHDNRDATIHNFTIQYASQYIIHDMIRIMVHSFDKSK
jgi:hypothetical protein